jgi:hypothetical protein
MSEIERVEKKRGGARPGSGMKPKQKTKKTIEREVALKQYQQLVLKRLKPIFEHQYALVEGVSYLYRIDETKNGGKEHVIVQNPDEIGDVLAQAHDDGGFVEGVYNDKFYYITVKPPDNSAIKDMLDRSIGKTQSTPPGDPNKIAEVTVIRYAQ